jgi:hypothetical protein
MNSEVNRVITGEYDHVGEALAYCDTDSNFCDTIHRTNAGKFTSEALFELCPIKWKNGDKEYAADDRLQVLSYDPITDKPVMKPFNYVYRHKVRKQMWRITDANGNAVIVTEDHSVMIERDGDFVEVKPRDIVSTDVLISVVD